MPKDDTFTRTADPGPFATLGTFRFLLVTYAMALAIILRRDSVG